MAAGIVKVTRSVVATIVVTAVAFVVTAVPPAAGFRVMVTLTGGIVPVGKLEPVTFITVTPGSPEAGDVVGDSVTWTGDWARAATVAKARMSVRFRRAD
jgi:hypothetical protein